MMFAERHPLFFLLMVGVTLVFAMIVAIMPISIKFQVLRPELVCILVLYWVLSSPQFLGIGFAFLVGLLQDVIEQGVWGAHAMGLTVVAYICVNSYQRMKSYSVWHQSLWVSVLIGLHQVIVNWLQGLAGYSASFSSLVASVVITSLLWPVVQLALHRFRLHYRLI